MVGWGNSRRMSEQLDWLIGEEDFKDLDQPSPATNAPGGPMAAADYSGLERHPELLSTGTRKRSGDWATSGGFYLTVGLALFGLLVFMYLFV